MLENLRRKSLVKTYHDPIHQVHFEQGLARYRNHAEIGVCTQKLSKDLPESLFKKAIDKISKEGFSFFKLTMIYCPKGTFTMGHIDQENNQPRQETIERPFLLGETEITQELYTKVIGKNPSDFRNRPQNPVEFVSWEDAILFCNALSKLQGLELCYTKNSDENFDWNCDFDKNGYRLPKQKEWEYAAKAGTNNRWAGTNAKDKLSEYAWFGGGWRTGGSTHPVATKLPNGWGFYDMSGNVWEMCWEWCGDKTEYAVCGGGWNTTDASYLRSACRYPVILAEKDNAIGFRVCRSVVN